MAIQTYNRPSPPLGDVGQASWNQARGPLYRFLRWMLQEHSATQLNVTNIVTEVNNISGGGGGSGTDEDARKLAFLGL